MKHKLLTAALAVLVVFAAQTLPDGTKVAASSLTPGSASDPLVSRSYVDDKFNQLLGMIGTGGTGTVTGPTMDDATVDAVVAEVMSRLEYYITAKGGGDASAFHALQIKAGQILVGDEGAELIPRSGTSTVYSLVTDGVADVTTGIDLRNGAKITNNHLLIIPRGDGRGIKASTDVWVLVKGGYTIR